MSFVVRRVTLGKARELYNDLLANMANMSDYKGTVEYLNDLELFSTLSSWIRVEEMSEKRDTQVDDEGRGF